MRVVGERLDNIGVGMDELAVEPFDELGVLQHHLGHERAGLETAAPHELEETALGAGNGAVR